MIPSEIPLAWSRQFGLALGPLFETGEVENPDEHHVLLDGGGGTFALSSSDQELWRDTTVASWVWSGDIPHHVTVTPAKSQSCDGTAPMTHACSGGRAWSAI
jgi:hypothetical protein